MRNEIIHVLTNLKEEKIKSFAQSLSIDELETVVHLLDYTKESVRARWENTI